MKRKCSCVLILFLCALLLLPMVHIPVSAHEIYTYNGTPVELVRSSSALRYNDDGLSENSIYGNYVSTAASQWNTSYTSLTYSSISSSNVDLSTMSESYWDNYYGGTHVAAAYTWIFSSGTRINSASSAYNSNGTITMSQIYFNPYHDSGSIYAPTSAGLKTKIIVHEMGHAFCLGHSDGYSPTTTSSVMYSDPSAYSMTTYTLWSHDLSDLAAKY